MSENKWQKQNLRRRTKGLSEEEKLKKIKEIQLKDRMKEIRYAVLKAFRDDRKGL